MERWNLSRQGAGLLVAIAAMLAPVLGQSAGWTIVGWNDLGMHCMDADYRVFSILPPYNTIHAQLVDDRGNLVQDPTALGITVTYEAVADPSGSINTTSSGKTNFWEHVAALFGASPPVDEGLTGSRMPGAGNTPRPMTWEPDHGWFTAEAIPITPWDDAYRRNPYPMMRLVARDADGTVLATSDIVLPVSDEMNCRACHASGSDPAARPSGGWVHAAHPARDERLNILRLHDERHLGDPLYQSALADNGYAASGLFDTATRRGRAILCANCHSSNALPGHGVQGVPALTRAIHGFHAHVTDPDTGMTLDAAANRDACYRCHPGAATQCLRGAMGGAVAADGSRSIQCQNCHGAISRVGDPAREGWFDEPVCQSCHTGTATHNNGQIRYSSVFEPDGSVRQAVDPTFATSPDVPDVGLSLYRFSSGHGGLQCEACHGSPHAIFPTIHANDNVYARQLQGHRGTLVECTTCHAGQPQTDSGGPHGMHPVGQSWVEDHKHAAESGGLDGCRRCHGADDGGTVLSRSHADRTLSTDFGPKHFWRGFQIGCYTCHKGPHDEHANPNHAPSAEDRTASTSFGTPVDLPLGATDPDGDALTRRIVSQPGHGTVALAGATATYLPAAGFAGTDTFTWAASDGQTDSNLATVTVTVAPPVSPPPVPDGATVAGRPVTLTPVPGEALRIAWDVTRCPAPGYHALWLDLQDPAAYRVVGSECALGATGDRVVVPPGGVVGLLLAADDGATTEGSYGTDSGGGERPVDAALECGMTDKRTDGTCPAP